MLNGVATVGVGDIARVAVTVRLITWPRNGAEFGALVSVGVLVGLRVGVKLLVAVALGLRVGVDVIVGVSVGVDVGGGT